jgi:hypothetical protein
MDWIYLAQDMDKWQGLVNTVINLEVTQNAGYFLTHEGHSSFLLKDPAR